MTETTGDLSSAEVELIETLVLSRHWSEEHRRRYEEDGHAMTHGEAVEVFRRIGAKHVDPYSVWFPDLSKDPVLLSSVNMICAPDRGGVYFRELAVRAIIEGFERSIAENSNVLYILYDGEAEAREVGSWERFLAYEALRFFMENVPGEDRNSTVRDCFDRAEAILARVTVNRPQGRHDPTSTAARNERIYTLLHLFQGCGLPVTSLAGQSLAGAMSEATGIPERTIASVWEEAPSLLRGDKRSRKRFADVPCARCGCLKVPVWRACRGDYNPLCDQCSPTLGV